MKLNRLFLIILTIFALGGELVRGADNAVLYWNDQVLNATRLARNPPPIASLHFATYHAAIFDAVNGITRTHKGWLVNDPAPTGASVEAAIASASLTVLNALWGQATNPRNFQIAYDKALATIADGQAKTDGVAWGKQVAEAILADNDGWLDFYVGTGNPDFAMLIPNRMFRNDGGKRFQEVTSSGGFGQLQKGHAIAFADFNNDGEQDVFSKVGGAAEADTARSQLFANPGHGNNWLKLKLQGVKTNRAAIGARIKVVVQTEEGERAIYRTVGSGGSFGASPMRQEIGIGQAKTIKRVEIFWPVTGVTQVVTSLEINQLYQVREGDPAAVLIQLKKFKWPGVGQLP